MIQMLRLETDPIPAVCESYGYDARVRLYLSHFINSELELVDRSTSESRKFKHLKLYETVLS